MTRKDQELARGQACSPREGVADAVGEAQSSKITLLRTDVLQFDELQIVAIHGIH